MSTMPKGIHKHLLHRPKPIKRGVAGTAQLTYFIFEGVLTGYIS